MENKLTDNSTAVVEKVSKKQIKQTQAEIKLSEDDAVSNLVKVAFEMTDEELDKAIAFLDKKIELLKKLK